MGSGRAPFRHVRHLWIIQTVPALAFGLYTRWCHRLALVSGCLAGLGLGTWMEAGLKFKSAVFPLHLFGLMAPTYIALIALVANILVMAVLTVPLRVLGVREGTDQTAPADHEPAVVSGASGELQYGRRPA